jgi:hypothetical protein
MSGFANRSKNEVKGYCRDFFQIEQPEAQGNKSEEYYCFY